jgi:hypothetical protein
LGGEATKPGGENRRHRTRSLPPEQCGHGALRGAGRARHRPCPTFFGRRGHRDRTVAPAAHALSVPALSPLSHRSVAAQPAAAHTRCRLPGGVDKRGSRHDTGRRGRDGALTTALGQTRSMLPLQRTTAYRNLADGPSRTRDQRVRMAVPRSASTLGRFSVECRGRSAPTRRRRHLITARNHGFGGAAQRSCARRIFLQLA